MKTKLIGVTIVLSILLAFVVLTNQIPNATFSNLEPSVTLNETSYQVCQEIVPEDELERKIGKVTKYSNLVSYTEEDNPYKKVGYIWSITNEADSIALEMNGKYYLCQPEQ